MSKQLFDDVVEQLETSLDKKGNHLDMVSLIVSFDEETCTHSFKKDEKIDVRSIAKPILCLALGTAIEEGLYFDDTKITLETPVWEFISEYATIDNLAQQEKWEEVRLIDLLRITLGHDKGIMFSADVKEHDEDDLVNYVVNYPITESVGSHFVYSNAGSFLISTLISEYCGMDADQFVNELIFSKLGIRDYSWKKFGKYCTGCTGLEMRNEDLHKIGILLRDGGLYNGERIVPARWITQMRSAHVPAPTHRYIAERAFPKWSYGLNLWICEDGNYYCDGTNGQYLMVLPEKGIVLTATGLQSDTQPVSESFGLLK